MTEEQTLPPKGWDFCKWPDATGVMTPTGGIYGIKLKKVRGFVDSFVVYFEPGQSEIGTHQAKWCLGMKPVRQNAEFDSEDMVEEESHTVTFDFMRERMARKIRHMAESFSEAASQVEKGDFQVFETIHRSFEHEFNEAMHFYRFLCDSRDKVVTEEQLVNL